MKQLLVHSDSSTWASLMRISVAATVGNWSGMLLRKSYGSISGPAWVISLPLLTLAVLLAGCNRATHEATGASREEGKLQRLAKGLDDEIGETERQTTALAEQVVAAYKNLAEAAKSVNSEDYRLEPNGVLHRPSAVKTDVPAVFVSGAVAVDERIMTIVKGTEPIDTVLKELVRSSELIVQAYYNDRNSYNRIYPPFYVLAQYPPGMQIPKYNFYYLADEKNNPGRKSTWIKNPYVDPAGRGWMVSCLAPVYRNDQLEGVCGLDVTVEALVREMELESANNLYIVVSNDGIVVAAGERMARVLRLPNLKRHRYVDTVRSDTVRTDDYNLRKSSSAPVRNMINEFTVNGKLETQLNLDGQKWRVRSVSLTRLGWYILEFATLP
jgi:hypothetical protein